MPTHVALLRGLNVGRSNRISMADLRASVESLGHRDVRTYLQSGNVVLTPAGDAPPATLAADLAAALERGRGLTSHVVVLTAQDWREIVGANPYAAPARSDPTTVHAAIQQDLITPLQRQALASVLADTEESGGAEHLSVVGRTTYLLTPDGLGRSRLSERLARARAAGQDRATARNWRTVEAIASLLEG